MARLAQEERCGLSRPGCRSQQDYCRDIKTVKNLKCLEEGEDVPKRSKRTVSTRGLTGCSEGAE